MSRSSEQRYRRPSRSQAPPRPTRPECGKRCYASRGDAKRAMACASNAIRVYWCDACRSYHVCNREKKGRW